MKSQSYTLAELARKARLTESTARRYTRLFAEFIPSEDRGRVRLFSPTCVPVLKRIKALYDAGRSTDQVRDILDREFDRTVDIEVAHDDEQQPSDAYDLAEQLVNVVQRNYQADQDLHKLKRAVQALAGHVQQIRGEQKALPDPQTMEQVLARLSNLEKKVETLENERRAPWWQKLKRKWNGS